jgi:hypothetical protein
MFRRLVAAAELRSAWTGEGARPLTNACVLVDSATNCVD